jgi:hypothetical protein
MTLPPLWKVKVGAAVQFDWITVENVRHEREETVGSELVGDELSVVELVADDVGENQHGIVGGFVLGVGGVDLKVLDGGETANGLPLMLDALVAAGTGGVGGHCD